MRIWRVLAVATLAVPLLGCPPIKLVTVALVPARSECEDNVDGEHITLSKNLVEGVVWRLSNQCGHGAATVKFEWKDPYPVAQCVTSPPDPNFAIDQEFQVETNKHIFCIVASTASLGKHKYHIHASVRRADGTRIERTHELDIGVTP